VDFHIGCFSPSSEPNAGLRWCFAASRKTFGKRRARPRTAFPEKWRIDRGVGASRAHRLCVSPIDDVFLRRLGAVSDAFRRAAAGIGLACIPVGTPIGVIRPDEPPATSIPVRNVKEERSACLNNDGTVAN
jgi:hypothetical protein